MLAVEGMMLSEEKQIAWAAGLFIGEGSVGSCLSKKNHISYEYLDLQISMMDERAIVRFAKIFHVNVIKLFLKLRGYYIYKVHTRGRTAERMVGQMWNHLRGTDKGDQAVRVCKRLRISDYVIGRKFGMVRAQRQNNKRGRKGGVAIFVSMSTPKR